MIRASSNGSARAGGSSSTSSPRRTPTACCAASPPISASPPRAPLPMWRRRSPPPAPPRRRWRSSTIWRRPGARTRKRPRRCWDGWRRSRACGSSSPFAASRPTFPAPARVTLQDVERLGEADARALFLRRAGDQFAADPALPGLLQRARRPSVVDRAARRQRRRQVELAGPRRRLERPSRRHAATRGGRRPQDEPAGLARPFARRAQSAERGASPDPPDGAAAGRHVRGRQPHDPQRRRADERGARRGDGSKTRASPAAPTAAGGCLRRCGRRCSPIFRPRPQTGRGSIKLFLARAAIGRERRDGQMGRRERTKLIAEAGNLDAMIGVVAAETELPEGILDAVLGPRRVPSVHRPRFDRVPAGGGEAVS